MKYLTYFLVCLSFCLNAQNYYNNWYFGANVGLNFSGGIATPITGGMINNPDPVSTISDASGNLLFYTDGMTVWNQNNVAMPNGQWLLGNYTAGQCALIVPIPCSSRYVIFTNTEFSSPGYLRYSVVDMALNGGLGDVETIGKNTSLGTGWTKKMCAYYYAPGNYYWVVTHTWNTSDFVALKVNSSGVTTQSVISTVGTVHNCGSYSSAHDGSGQLTISPDGLHIANALTCQDFNELFDFDPSTGQVSNPIYLSGDNGNAWGTAFSPNSNLLYTNSIFGSNVYQFDITLPNSSAILASKTQIGTSGTSGYSFGYMELGPNNKIYLPRPNTSYLAEIGSPNLVGVSSAFVLNGVNLGSMNSTWGLSRAAYNIQPGNVLICAATSNSNCAGQTVTITASGAGQFLWNSIVGSNTHTFVVNSSTVISVSQISGCASATMSFAPIQGGTLSCSASSNSNCAGQVVTMTAAGSGPFLWNSQPGSNTYTFALTSPTVINVTQSTNCNNSSLIFTPSPNIPVSFTIMPGAYCIGDTVTITTNANGNVFWNSVGGGNTYTTIVNGPSTVTISTATGCSNTLVNLTPNGGTLGYSIFPAQFCAGQTVTITMNLGGVYIWNGIAGTSTKIITVNTTTVINAYVQGECAFASMTLTPAKCTGIENNTITVSKLTCVPNPVKDQLEITTDELTGKMLEIFSCDGRRVMGLEFENGQNKVKVNVSDLAPGIYIVSSKYAHTRFIKE